LDILTALMRPVFSVGFVCALMTCVVASAEVPSEVTLIAHDVPGVLAAGMRLQVSVELRNNGTETWTAEDGYAVAYHWRDTDDGVVVWDGLRSAFSEPVGPGRATQVDAVLEVPTEPGGYRLQWDVVREGVRWLSEGAGVDRESIPVEVRVGHAFSVVEWRPPRRLAPGSEVTRRVLLRNDGTVTWRAGGRFTVSYHWFSRTGEVVVWDGLRSRIPGAIEPGASVEVMTVVRAPDKPGRYQLQLDLVHEGVTWFSQRDPTPEARSAVLIAGIPGLGTAGWFFVTLIVAAAAFLVARRGRPAVLLSWVAVADVVWCFGSVMVKQDIVLDAAGQRPTLDGWLLMGGGAAIVLLPVLLFPTRVRPWVVWGVAALATFLLFTDVVYQRFFGDLVSVAVLGAASQVGRVRASILSLVEARDLWVWPASSDSSLPTPACSNKCFATCIWRARSASSTTTPTIWEDTCGGGRSGRGLTTRTFAPWWASFQNAQICGGDPVRGLGPHEG